MKNPINIVLIRTNGLTVTFQAETWTRMAERVLEEIQRAARDRYVRPIARIFVSDGDALSEHTEASVKLYLECGGWAAIDAQIKNQDDRDRERAFATYKKSK